jgi:Peptidoglycan-binding protein, CsiV
MQGIREHRGALARGKGHRVYASVPIVQLVCLALFAPAAGAQDEAPLPAGEPRFNVELIVFSYRAADSAGNEVFVPDEPTLVPDAEEELPPDVAQNTFGDDVGEPVPEYSDTDITGNVEDERDPVRRRIELQLLDSEKHTMSDIYRKLEQLDAYQPIMHAAWTQTTPPKEAAPAIHLRALGELPPGLDGSITLYRGRYLHLVVDLALDANERDSARTATDRLISYSDGSAQEADGSDRSEAFLQPVRYRILEDRIMKTGDLRYFDHPRFGVVARVTRPEDEPADAASGGAD